MAAFEVLLAVNLFLIMPATRIRLIPIIIMAAGAAALSGPVVAVRVVSAVAVWAAWEMPAITGTINNRVIIRISVCFNPGFMVPVSFV